ncbi:MAG TPA: hypothetical protein VJ963_04525 [Bacteroidales bacterium]|nr:hypothetical protein [Bacteroidales bacterium]
MKKNRINNSKKWLLILTATLFSVSLHAQKVVDFTGSWTLNESKSKMGEEGQRMLAKNLNITQGENSITIERIFSGMNGDERKMTDTYTLDGKESVNPIFNTTKKSIAKWSGDMKRLEVSSVIELNMHGETTEIKTAETYSLGDDAKTLIIDSKSSSPRGDRQATFVYDKNI